MSVSSLSTRLRVWLFGGIDHTIWELRRGVRAFTRLFGLWAWGVLAACAVAVIASWSGRLERAELETLIAHQTAQTEAAGRASMQSLAQRNGDRVDDGRSRMKAFEDHLLPHEDIALAVENLVRLAESEGLSIARGEYRPQADPVGGFLRYRMSLPVKGQVAAVYAFIQSALLMQKALAVESVQFKREQAVSGHIEVRIQWVLLTRLPADRAGQKAISRTGSGDFE